MKTYAARTERVSETELVITRAFRAPAAVLFEAWTRPELVRRWWAPASRGVTMLVCEAEVRVGGAYRYVLGRSEAESFAFSGRYLELEPPGRLVYTQRFEPFPDEAVIDVRFEHADGVTTLVSRERYPSKDALDMAIANGMEDGMNETFDQLDRLVQA